MVAIMLIVGICLGALIVVAAYAGELKRIAEALRTRSPHSNARITLATGAPGLRPLADAINQVLDCTTQERIEAQRAQEEFQRDLSALSHDIRTPLTGAKGYLQLARDERDGTTRARHLEAAASRIDSTTELLDELFAYTKSSDPDLVLTMERVAIRPLIERVLLGHYPEFEERGWEPELAFDADDLAVQANLEALARICENLAINAIRHGSGAPRIRAEHAAGTAHIVFENPVAPGAAIDTSRLFDCFYQADDARGSTGSGLGLSVCANLAHAMGMEISAACEDGVLAITITAAA